MARVCMSIENAPPEDWLMSKNREFTHQSTRFNEYKAQWAKSFPGKNSSLDSKLAWGHSIELKYSYDNDELDLDEQSDPWRPQLESGSMRCVLGEILHQASDPTLQLQLLVARNSIAELQFECTQKLFSSKAAKLSGARSKGEGSIEEHKAWLQKQPTAKIPSSRESIKSADLVVLATLQVSRDDHVLDTVKLLLKDEMGLSLQEYGTVGGFDENNIENPLNQPPEGEEQFGGMAYFPSGQKKHADVVMLRVEFATGGDGVADEWRKEVEKAKQTCQSNEETARDYLLVPRPGTPESDKQVVSGDTHYVLWLPKGYHELHSRVSEHLHRGAGEIEHVQSSIRLGCTSGGNVKLELVEREFNALKDVNDWPQKLCWLLALTRAISWDCHFLNDNEFPEEAAVILGKIATYWRTSILKRTGQELHLGLADDEASQVESREALLTLLRTLKGHIEGSSGCEWAPIKFGCVPGKPRKRSNKRPLAQIYANNVQA